MEMTLWKAGTGTTKSTVVQAMTQQMEEKVLTLVSQSMR
jgi:hypothetical protein